MFIPDITNKLCREYEIINIEEITFRWKRDLPLEPKGPCDRMVGYSRSSWKVVQNWIRDMIKEGKK